MKVVLLLSILTMLMLVVSTVSLVSACTSNREVYACRFAEAKIVQSNKDLPVCEEGKITVAYGDVGSYYGKGKVVIKNLDTGQTLVTHDLNFAKQHKNQGNDCCVKVYTFDDSKTHHGDDISVKVTGGGGSWTNGPYDYENNLRISVSLEEIGEDVDGNMIYNNNNNNNNNNKDNHKKIDNSDEYICDSDSSTSAPSCDDFEKEFQGDQETEETYESTGNLTGD